MERQLSMAVGRAREIRKIHVSKERSEWGRNFGVRAKVEAFGGKGDHRDYNWN